MTKLKCNVTSCRSNSENCCCRPEIRVDGVSAQACDETCCASFQPKSNGAENSCCDGYVMPDEKAEIACDAYQCKHNSTGHCSAESVCVACSCGDACTCTQTECSTFKKK